MPTTYAHDRFGREVYEQLPVNLKKIIRENKKLYLIGLHGPDIFFYYHPFSKNRVSDYGTFLHEQTASVLFEDEVKKYQQSPSEAMEAYLLGFACHYLLDSTCHPYIGKFVDHTGISHTKIETSLDQYFMLEDGLDPLVYRPASPICPHTDGNKVIHRCFPEIGDCRMPEGHEALDENHDLPQQCGKKPSSWSDETGRLLRFDGRPCDAWKAAEGMRSGHMESCPPVRKSACRGAAGACKAG